jgi:hypothetical protein
MQEMKRNLLLIAALVLIVNSVGCGAFRCRHRVLGAPLLGRMNAYSAPVCCETTCCQPVCDPCSSSVPVSMGVESGAVMMPADSGCACGP